MSELLTAILNAGIAVSIGATVGTQLQGRAVHLCPATTIALVDPAVALEIGRRTQGVPAETG